MVQPVAIKPNIDLLDFDPENPRFFDTGGNTPSTTDAALRRMFEEENLEELVGSIGQQDFFPGEPLLIAPNPRSNGRYIVVEGNRRLAALQVLSGSIPNNQMPNSLAALAESANFHPAAVECFEFPSRRDVLKYLGFRHISGPRRWEPLAKARYLADLIKNFYATLALEEQLRAVAKDIGSRRDYVAQLLTALNLYDRAKAARFYGLQRVDEFDISFSLLSTALSYTNIVSFLNLPRRDAVLVDTVNDNHAKELLSWMFAQDQRGETVLGESRRLKELAAVVGSEVASAELRKHNNLDQAYLFTSGPADAFASLLATAESSISDCLGLLGPSFEADEGHIAKVEKIIDGAQNLELLLRKGMTQRTKRARQQQAEDDTNA